MSAWVRAAGCSAQVGGPGQEGLGLDEPGPGVLPGGGAQRPGGGPGAHPGQLVPVPELAQQPQVRVAGQGVQAAVQPGLEVAQLLVGGGQDAAADQQVAQVDDGARAGPGVECLVGERQRPGGQVRSAGRGCAVSQPVQGGVRAGRGGQGGGQRFQRRG